MSTAAVAVTQSRGAVILATDGRNVAHIINPATGRTLYGNLDPEELMASNSDLKRMTWEEFDTLHQAYWTSQPKPITEAQFEDALEVLPPEQFRMDANGLSFRMCEYQSGQMTNHYVRIGGKHFVTCQRVGTTHDQLIELCKPLL